MRNRVVVRYAIVLPGGCPSPPQPPRLTISPAQLVEAHVGEPYRETIAVTGHRTPVGSIEGEYVWHSRDGAWAPWKD